MGSPFLFCNKNCRESEDVLHMFEKYDDVVGINEAKEMLKSGRDFIYSIVNSGDLKHYKIGNKIRIPKKYIIEYIEKNIAS